MIFTDFNDFYKTQPKIFKLLSIDWGLKRIGLASSGNGTIALPKQTIFVNNQDKALSDITNIIKTEEYTGIIIGYPLLLDGIKSQTCEKIEEFSNKLVNLIDKPILLYDERLTSASAETMLIDDLNMKRNKRKQVLDSLASTIILEDVLSKMQRIKQ